MLSEKELQNDVAHLRKALTPEPETLGDIPEFDLGRAYDLYSKLLKPVEDSWINARDLLVVAPGPLGQLPLSVLPITSVRPGREKNDRLSKYNGNNESIWNKGSSLRGNCSSGSQSFRLQK